MVWAIRTSNMHQNMTSSCISSISTAQVRIATSQNSYQQEHRAAFSKTFDILFHCFLIYIFKGSTRPKHRNSRPLLAAKHSTLSRNTSTCLAITEMWASAAMTQNCFLHFAHTMTKREVAIALWVVPETRIWCRTQMRSVLLYQKQS